MTSKSMSSVIVILISVSSDRHSRIPVVQATWVPLIMEK
jgi:hypothetical protein